MAPKFESILPPFPARFGRRRALNDITNIISHTAIQQTEQPALAPRDDDHEDNEPGGVLIDIETDLDQVDLDQDGGVPLPRENDDLGAASSLPTPATTTRKRKNAAPRADSENAPPQSKAEFMQAARLAAEPDVVAQDPEPPAKKKRGSPQPVEVIAGSRRRVKSPAPRRSTRIAHQHQHQHYHDLDHDEESSHHHSDVDADPTETGGLSGRGDADSDSASEFDPEDDDGDAVLDEEDEILLHDDADEEGIELDPEHFEQVDDHDYTSPSIDEEDGGIDSYRRTKSWPYLYFGQPSTTTDFNERDLQECTDRLTTRLTRALQAMKLYSQDKRHGAAYLDRLATLCDSKGKGGPRIGWQDRDSVFTKKFFFVVTRLKTAAAVRKILARIPNSVRMILGKKQVTVDDLLQLPLLNDEQIENHLVYLKLITNKQDRKRDAAYVGMHHRGRAKGHHRFTTYNRVVQDGKTTEGLHCEVMLEPGARTHMRAIAVGFDANMPVWTQLTESLFMIILGTNLDAAKHRMRREMYNTCRQALGDVAIDLHARTLNKTLSIRQPCGACRIPPCWVCDRDCRVPREHDKPCQFTWDNKGAGKDEDDGYLETIICTNCYHGPRRTKIWEYWRYQQVITPKIEGTPCHVCSKKLTWNVPKSTKHKVFCPLAAFMPDGTIKWCCPTCKPVDAQRRTDKLAFVTNVVWRVEADALRNDPDVRCARCQRTAREMGTDGRRYGWGFRTTDDNKKALFCHTCQLGHVKAGTIVKQAQLAEWKTNPGKLRERQKHTQTPDQICQRCNKSAATIKQERGLADGARQTKFANAYDQARNAYYLCYYCQALVTLAVNKAKKANRTWTQDW